LTLFTAEYEKCVTQVVETFLVYFFLLVYINQVHWLKYLALLLWK